MTETEPDAVTLTSISITPNNCHFEEPLQLSMQFTAHRPITQASWHVKFIADTAYSRKIIELGTTPVVDYAVGENNMQFEVEAVRVEHLKRHVLANVGLLMANLFSGEAEVVQVSMVTQVTPDAGGNLVRSIYN